MRRILIFGNSGSGKTTLLLMLGGSHVNTELKGDSSLGSDGDRLPGSPEYNFNGRLHYRFQVANRDAFAQFEYLYVGGFYSDFAQATTEAGGYGQLDLRAGIALSENWDVQSIGCGRTGRGRAGRRPDGAPT